MKWNILRCLVQVGCEVTVVPGTASASDILARNPDGVFLSNGPGDPEPLGYAVEHHPRADRQEADLRHLPRPSAARPGVRRANVQAEIRPSRRQPAGPESDAPARSRSPRKITVSPSHRHRCPPTSSRRTSTSTTARWKACGTDASRSSACSITRKPRRGRTIARICSRNFAN